MVKQAKKTQTDWTRGGKAISDTAIPLYQKNLTRMDEYLENPTARVDELLNQYYTNTPKENDFLRNYQRAMGNVTANNYGATTGGYASRNQQNYDDYQRYMNDYAARLRAEGVNNAYNMAQGFYGNMLQANPQYQAAYNLGQPYSDVEQYNDMVDQVNSNWWAPVLSSAGSVISKIPHSATMAIGGAMQGAGDLFTVNMPGQSYATGTDTAGAFQNTGAGMNNAMGNIFGGLLRTKAGQDWLKGNDLAGFSFDNPAGIRDKKY